MSVKRACKTGRGSRTLKRCCLDIFFATMSQKNCNKWVTQLTKFVNVDMSSKVIVIFSLPELSVVLEVKYKDQYPLT